MKSVLVAFGLLCACVVPDSDEVATLEQPIFGGGNNCDEWGCGMNSPNIDSYGFHFLYKTMNQQNPQGFAIAAFIKYINGAYRALAFNVVNGRITGTMSDGTVLGEYNLVGAKLYISYHGTVTYRIRIKDYATTQSWAVNSLGQRFRVRTYLFEWEKLSEPDIFYNVCSNPGSEDTLGMNTHHTLVFEGDVIDAATKRFQARDPNVVNFGCAGGTLAKMHLTGHTQVASNLGPEWYTSISQRQATLKMLAADYCGDGKAYTIGGQPLTWADDKNWMNASAFAEREANWSSRGATCLNVPRLAWTDVANTYPGLRDEITAHCSAVGHPVEWCESDSLEPDVGYHMVSANPPIQ